MSQVEDVNDVEAFKDQINKEINDLKHGQAQIKNDVDALKLNDKLQDKEISTMQDTLKSIQDDTTWIRRKITSAIITATITAVIAGLVGFAISKIFGG